MNERVINLYRVSTMKQVDFNAENQADIPMQRKACREFAESMGWTVVDELQENGVSGFKVHAADRDKIQYIKEAAREGKFDILLVFMFDRIGRIAAETPFIVEELVQCGIRVWSVKEGEQRFDSHTDFLTNYIRFWQADGESKKTSIRTKTALSQMVQEGRFRGGVAPYGYRLEKSGILNKRRHEVNKLVIDENEAAVVHLMFNMVVASGYGRWRLAMFLNEKGILTRDGQNWHDATVGHILHNVMYKGILRSGETYSEPFTELQIIDPTIFDRAQEIMSERARERAPTRTMPLQTTSPSILTGYIFCGHCGGRMRVTTGGKVIQYANGETNKAKRYRYVCYNKTRRRLECAGPTGYQLHTIDSQVVNLLHEIFNRMAQVSDEELMQHIQDRNMIELQGDIKRAKTDNAKANAEYEALKSEVVKAVQGKSKMSLEVLNELVDEARNRVMDTSEKLTQLLAQNEECNNRKKQLQTELSQIHSWAEIFDTSEVDVKKMIASSIIKRVNVFDGGKLEIELNMCIQQFVDGMDSIAVEADCHIDKTAES